MVDGFFPGGLCCLRAQLRNWTHAEAFVLVAALGGKLPFAELLATGCPGYGLMGEAG